MSNIELPEGVELPNDPMEEEFDVPAADSVEAQDPTRAQANVGAVVYTRDSKKVVFAVGQWEIDQYGVSGQTSSTQATIVPHANVSRIVMEFQPETAE